MSDVIVISSTTTPAAIYNTVSRIDKLTAWKTALLAAGLFLKLFKNNIIVAPSTTLADFDEAAAPGYAPLAIAALDGPYADQAGNAYLTTPLNLFTTSGGGTDLEYGCYVVEVTGAAATVTFTLVGGAYTAPVIGGGGAGYIVPPTVRVTGATGSGAVLHAVITGGVVTDVIIDSPGTAYTTATATIDPPEKLIIAANFPGPMPLQLVTDAIAVVLEIDEVAA